MVAQRRRGAKGGGANLFSNLLNTVAPQQCESNYDCEAPLVCCDLIVASVCCSSGMMIGPPQRAVPQMQRQEIPVPVDDDNFPPRGARMVLATAFRRLRDSSKRAVIVSVESMVLCAVVRPENHGWCSLRRREVEHRRPLHHARAPHRLCMFSVLQSPTSPTTRKYSFGDAVLAGWGDDGGMLWPMEVPQQQRHARQLGRSPIRSSAPPFSSALYRQTTRTYRLPTWTPSFSMRLAHLAATASWMSYHYTLLWMAHGRSMDGTSPSCGTARRSPSRTSACPY